MHTRRSARGERRRRARGARREARSARGGGRRARGKGCRARGEGEARGARGGAARVLQGFPAPGPLQRASSLARLRPLPSTHLRQLLPQHRPRPRRHRRLLLLRARSPPSHDRRRTRRRLGSCCRGTRSVVLLPWRVARVPCCRRRASRCLVVPFPVPCSVPVPCFVRGVPCAVRVARSSSSSSGVPVGISALVVAGVHAVVGGCEAVGRRRERGRG